MNITTLSLKDFPVGEQRDFRANVSTKEVFRVSENKFEINCFVSGWLTAKATKKKMQQLIDGKLKLSDLSWE